MILRFAGYDLLHYIPYTAYNRLLKENYRLKPLDHPKPQEREINLSQLTDFAHLELLDQPAGQKQSLQPPWVAGVSVNRGERNSTQITELI